MSAEDFHELYDYELHRKPLNPSDRVKSANIDCMIALGMQHAQLTGIWRQIMGLLRLDSMSKEELAWPGIAHIQRAQSTLRRVTSRCIHTLRCYALLALYLRKVGDVEGAYNVTGIGLRRATMANLHRDTASDSNSQVRLARVRVWWLLYSLDTFCSVQLGVFTSVQNTNPITSIPAVMHISHISQKTLADEKCGLACLAQVAKLATATAMVENHLPSSLVSVDQERPEALEETAQAVSRALRPLEAWRRELPQLFSSRYCDLFFDHGSRTTLALADLDSPAWLLRQRLLLALQYHMNYLCIQRPFLSCCTLGASNAQHSAVQSLAHNSVEHAITIIHTLHTVCGTSSALYGWSEVLQPLWDATVNSVAYVHLHPFGNLSSLASRSITMARALFELFAPVSPVAAEAQDMIASQVHQMALMDFDRAPMSAEEEQRDFFDGSIALSDLMNGPVDLGQSFFS